MEPKKIYIWSDPNFSEVLIFHQLDAVSFRDPARRKIYSTLIKEQLSKIACENWPYNKPLMIAIGISGPPKKYGKRDLDNMAKVILDAGNKIIYTDDRLIQILLVQKQLWSLPEHGFMVGTRPMSSEGKDQYTPVLIHSSDVQRESPEDVTQPVIFQNYFENGQPFLRHIRSADEL